MLLFDKIAHPSMYIFSGVCYGNTAAAAGRCTSVYCRQRTTYSASSTCRLQRWRQWQSSCRWSRSAVCWSSSPSSSTTYVDGGVDVVRPASSRRHQTLLVGTWRCLVAALARIAARLAATCVSASTDLILSTTTNGESLNRLHRCIIISNIVSMCYQALGQIFGDFYEQ